MTGGSDTYISVKITYVHSTKGLKRTFTSTTPGTSWTDNGWNASPPGNYTITATVTNDLGCAVIDWIDVTATNPPQTGP